MRSILPLLLALALLSCAQPSPAQVSFSTRIVADSLFIPWEILYGPDGNIWFTQKNGYICRVAPATGAVDTVYHESNTVVNNEGGMLGMSLHPLFPAQPYVFVAYEYTSGASYKERIVRYTWNAAQQTLGTPMVLLDNISGASIHNGCRVLAVGDKLFISTGDAAMQSTPQNLQSLNGKIHRINFDGSIPADNPIPGSSIWSWGHRNAQGLVYANGMLYSSEHGPNNDDEINIIKKGRNYGWPNVQGFCNTSAEQAFCTDSNVVEPLFAWTPTLAVCGIDYYDKAMFPTLQGSLLLTTLKDNNLYQLVLNSSKDAITSVVALPGVSFGRLRDICIAPTGQIYLSTSNSSANGSNQKDKIIEIYNPLSVANQHKAGTVVLQAFPNPAREDLRLEAGGFPTGRLLSWQVTDLQGRVVAHGAHAGLQWNISVAAMPAGSYFAQVWDAAEPGNVAAVQFVKQ